MYNTEKEICSNDHSEEWQKMKNSIRKKLPQVHLTEEFFLLAYAKADQEKIEWSEILSKPV